MRRSTSKKIHFRQRGATLVVALLILVLIMMIGITAVVTSNTQYKLAGNLQFEDSAMNNAETAVVTAENWLITNYTNPGFTTYSSGGTPYLYPMGVSLDPTTMTWDNSNSLAVSPQQRYFIQLLSLNNTLPGSSLALGGRKSIACNTVNTFEVTGLGTSARGAKKLVRTYYSVQNC